MSCRGSPHHRRSRAMVLIRGWWWQGRLRRGFWVMRSEATMAIIVIITLALFITGRLPTVMDTTAHAIIGEFHALNFQRHGAVDLHETLIS